MTDVTERHRIVTYRLDPNNHDHAGDHVVFDPSSSTLYYVNAAWSDHSHGYYVQDARAIVTLESLHDLSAADLTLYKQYVNEHVSDPATSYAS